MSGRKLRSCGKSAAVSAATAAEPAATASSAVSAMETDQLESSSSVIFEMRKGVAVCDQSAAAAPDTADQSVAAAAIDPVPGPSKQPEAEEEKEAEIAAAVGGSKGKRKSSSKPATSRKGKAANKKKGKASVPSASAEMQRNEILKMLLTGKTPKDPQTERKEHPTKKAEEVLLQLKVSLDELEPKEARAWRRILVPANMSFRELHVTIQKAFDWREDHLYEFKIGISNRHRFRRTLMEPTTIGEICPFSYNEDMVDAIQTQVHDYLWKEGDLAVYTYDLGDEWNHAIVVEKVLSQEEGENYPKVLAGKRRAPPEDCGSIPGFEHLLEVLKKPIAARTKDDKDLIGWLGESYPGYDPAHFDPSEVSYEGLFYF